MQSIVDEPSLEPCSCDVVDEGGFHYCFPTSSINSSHEATLFGVCSFIAFSLSSFVCFLLFIYLQRHKSLEQRLLCVMFGALGFF